MEDQHSLVKFGTMLFVTNRVTTAFHSRAGLGLGFGLGLGGSGDGGRGLGLGGSGEGGDGVGGLRERSWE